ncbi:MAG TPA: hypothetical protein VIF37_02395 [Methylobacter sp.]|jgi:uncharacterized protein YutE (UPF0331/DUF86 family)
MDWKQFISSIIENISWPIVTLIMFFLMRDQIGKLIEKIGHLKYKDLELDFDKVKKQAEAISVEKDKSIKVIQDPESIKVFSSLEEQILETVEKAPSAAILLAWSMLETSLASAVSRMAISPESPSYRSPLHNIDMLEKAGLLSKQHILLLHEMRTLRNKVAHEQATTKVISEEQALEYSNTAFEMTGVLNELNRKKKKFTTPEGDWITLPDNFSTLENKSANLWNYSEISIPGTNLKAGLGPWGSKGDYKCYGIDIEQPVGEGSMPIAELVFDISFVSDNFLDKQASELITYDSATRVVTFNLGNSIFEYKIN